MMKTELLLAAMEKPAMNNEFSRLNELFVAQLEEMYCCEQRFLKCISKMVRKASDIKLREVLEREKCTAKDRCAHIGEIIHVASGKANARECRIMTAIVEEAELIMSIRETGMIRDLAMMKAMAEASRYRISRYEILRAFSIAMRLQTAAGRLQHILENERLTEQSLHGLPPIPEAEFRTSTQEKRGRRMTKGFSRMPEYAV